MSNPVVVDVDDRGVATVTITRPEALNAINSAVIEGLIAAKPQLEQANLVIVTGSGEKAFVAGADIAEMVDFGPTEAEAFSRRGHEAFSMLANLAAPVVARVQGFALGGGLELALACDLIVAGPKAKVGLPESTLGVVPGFGGTQRLGRRIGGPQALKLLWTGAMLRAEEALALGIVDQVAEDLDAEMTTLVDSILRNGPLAHQANKRLVYDGLEQKLAQGNDLEAQAFGAIFGTDDQKEGMRAFLEKRKAVFAGQ